jgi:predicted permease
MKRIDHIQQLFDVIWTVSISFHVYVLLFTQISKTNSFHIICLFQINTIITLPFKETINHFKITEIDMRARNVTTFSFVLGGFERFE